MAFEGNRADMQSALGIVGECQSWGGHHRKSDGRPVVREGGKLVYVYRANYQKVHGALPRGKILHHRCENPRCINLDHLEVITQPEHLKRHDIHANHRLRKKNTCPKGHVYDGRNAVQRTCSICRHAAKLRYRQKQST